MSQIKFPSATALFILCVKNNHDIEVFIFYQ